MASTTTSPTSTTTSSTVAEPTPVLSLSSPTREEVLSCQFSNWYEIFRNLNDNDDDNQEKKRQQPERRVRRNNVTIKSIVIRPLSSDFVEFLESDGVRLPVGATKVSSSLCCTAAGRTPNSEIVEDEGEEEETSWSSCSGGEDDDEEENKDTLPAAVSPLRQSFSFPALGDQIEHAIQELGGAVMPKLNWSSPKDATWINNGTLQCQTPGDVYLLLQSSDFIMHDLLLVDHHAHSVKEQEDDDRGNEDDNNDDSLSKRSPAVAAIDYELVLRKWCNLHPSMEFRCFVYNRELVAITQRQHTQHFPHLTRDKPILRSQIIDFFDFVIEENFPLTNYVFDVYVDTKERVWLLDFNVWGLQTDALLFKWNELMSMAVSATTSDAHGGGNNEEEGQSSTNYPEMRVVETEREVHHDPLASYRAPIDTIELAAVTGSDRNKFDEFMAMCERPSNGD